MIKKLVYSLTIIAGLASCNDDYTDWAAPQTNAGKEAAAKFELAVQPSVSTIDFATETAENIQLFTANLTDGQQVKAYAVTLSAEENAATAVLQATAEGKVTSADLQEAVATIWGKAPVERTLTAEVAADVTILTENGSVVVEKQASPFTFKAKLATPAISEHYYLLVGEPDTWKLTDTSLMFTHSGKDVYDDPVFTIMLPVADGETWFAVTDDVTVEKNDWSFAFGCTEGNGNNGMEGSLARRSALSDEGAWKVLVDGDAAFVKITLDMMENSYKIEKINFAEYIYEVGENNGWGNGYALQGPAFDGIYYGAMYLKSGFKFRSNLSDWEGSGNWGLNESEDEGVLVNGAESKNISVAEEGFYKIVVDLSKMTYSLTPFTQLGIIGDGQPGGWDNDTPLTYDETEKCWKAAGVELTAGKSIKFRTVGTWDIVNIGGSLDNLVFNSNDNIVLAESGVFTVKLFLETQGQPYVKLIKE